jgi:PKD repeat protein
VKTVTQRIALLAVAGLLAGCSGEIKTEPDDTPPEVVLEARPTCGPVPLEVRLDASGTRDRESRILGFAWDLDGDGADDTLTTGAELLHTYAEPGTLLVRVRATNRDSLADSAQVEVWVLSSDADPTVCDYPHRRTASVRGIEYMLASSRSAFTEGDTLRFLYRITNERPATVSFPLHWTCRSDLYVFAGACSTLNAPACPRTWRSSDQAFCVNQPSSLTLYPDDSEYFVTTWFPRPALSAGEYTAFALLYRGTPGPNDSTIAWLRFRVE